MKLFEFMKELSGLGLTSFTLADAARVMRKKPEYVKLFLARAIKRGAIARVERGKFVLADRTPFEIAEAFGVGYVSFLSALSFHGLTSQLPRTLQLACPKPKKTATVGSARFVFIRLSAFRYFGFKRYGSVTVAEPEKAVLDGLYLPEHLPITEAASAVGQLDASKLVEYAKRFDSPIVAKRLGFLMERAGLDASGLRKLVTPSYGLLNPNLPSRGSKNAAWRILVNEAME
ncbi:hypothetical protein HYV43_06065 [Candidatus Micrarchaeota archaeon]|nr:hypothetical protein [Candidatus Micrarchaeota archaeon]